MTDVGEALKVEIAFDPGPWKCPFCEEKDAKGRTNDVSNNSSKLGTSIGDEPDWIAKYKHPMAGDVLLEGRLRTNAHHLIPADESFHPHPTIKKYVEASHGEIDADIGYGLNHRNNGVWLPTYPEEFATTRTTAPPVKWGDMTDNFPTAQFEVAKACIRAAKNRQFHDRHPDYSDFVKGCLDKICERLNDTRVAHECDSNKPMAKPAPAPFALVARLDGVSSRLRGYLTSAPLSWKDPLFTSRHSKKYHEDLVELNRKYASLLK
jgi:hypothetical protein